MKAKIIIQKDLSDPNSIFEYTLKSDCIIVKPGMTSLNIVCRDLSQPIIDPELEAIATITKQVACGNGPYSIRYTRLSVECDDYNIIFGNDEL